MATTEQATTQEAGAELDADQTLIERWIERNRYKPGIEEAQVVRFEVPVYALIGYLEAAGGDADRVARDYDVPREAVDAAIAYYRRHTAAIDARITANEPPE
jgi:uncharacterized protein (DUF433 family)